MSLDQTKLKHTICFCIYQDQVLMLFRKKSPNKDKWNGIGGKIEPGETPREGIFREAREEAEIDLNNGKVNFVGIVTWTHSAEAEIDGGMYAFIAYLDKQPFIRKKETQEGVLEFKSLKWVIDKKNKEVVKNIPTFLPVMLKNQKLYEFRCIYNEEFLLKITKSYIDRNQINI